MSYESVLGALESIDQQHLLKHYTDLDDAGQRKLLSQIEQIDFSYIAQMTEEYVKNKPETHIPADLSPAPYFSIMPEPGQEQLYDDAKRVGEELLSKGAVAALTVAGGQGTRLGFDGPKGTYPITPIQSKTFFQYFSESLIRVSEKYGCEMTWYIMTSILNDQPTRDFFEENDYFGLKKSNVIFFSQGTMPAIDYDGKLLLESKDSLALAPDGHGGTLLALRKSGALDRMKKDGVKYISYFQIDNPLVSVVDPLFIGLHHLEHSQMSARMLRKTNPYEKLGNFCVSTDRLTIIEYSDMPDDLANARNEAGELLYVAGSPAIHIISSDFVETLTEGNKLKLPWHRADKKVGYLNAAGEFIKPEETNAVKLESFIFDAIPMAEKTMVLEAKREEEFAPTKNPTGVDSVESCRQMLIDRDAARLKRAGVTIPLKPDGSPDCKVEISPLLVIDDDDARTLASKPEFKAPQTGAEVYYG